MIQVERRGSERGDRAEVWTPWRRLNHRHPWGTPLCKFALAAMLFTGAGVLVGWVLSHTWRWVEWQQVTITHSIKPDGNSELILDIDWRLKVTCDRLRITAPWSLIAYYPDRNVAVAMPRQPSDELITRAEEGHGRVIISLSHPLDRGVRHEISLGLSCLQDANGGTVHDADVEVVVKQFTP